MFFFSSRRRHTRCALVTGVQTCALPICSQLFAQVLDAKFAPHPGEVVGGHWVVRVELAAAAVFEMLEPPGYSVPDCGRLNGCARCVVAEYADGFIERLAVLQVEPGMAERGYHLRRNRGGLGGSCISI